MDEQYPPDAGPQQEPRDPSEPLSAVYLRRPPFWATWVTVLTAAGGFWIIQAIIGIVSAATGPTPTENLGVRLLWLMMLLTVVGVLLGRRYYLRSKPLPPIRFHDHDVELPLHANHWRTRRLKYREILSINLGGPASHLRILLESRRDIFHFDQPCFADPSGPELLFIELRRRILRLPDGRSIINAMHRRQTIAAKAFVTRPWATHIMLGILVILFANQVLFATQSPTGDIPNLELVAWGAVYGPLLSDGELYRLLAANFLHTGKIHILFNGVALFFLGGVMERFVGWQRLLVIYLTAGIGTTAAVVLSSETFAVGASGCVLGLFGGLAVLNWKYRTELPIPLRQTPRWWTFIIAINAPIQLLPFVAVMGHMGGLLTGAAVTWLMFARSKEVPVNPPPSALIRTLALGLIAAFAVGLATAVWYAKDYDRDAELALATRLARDAMRETPPNSAFLNEMAWTIAIHPQPDAASLQAAEDAASLAVETVDELGTVGAAIMRGLAALAQSDSELALGVGNLAKKDTLATVYYRQGKFAEAVRQQRAALEALPEFRGPGFGLFWSQLERFLTAWLKTRAPLDEVPLGARIQVQRETNRKATLVLNVDVGPPHNTLIYALVRRGDRRVGLLRIIVPAGVPLSSSFSPPDVVLGDNTTVDIAIVEDAGAAEPKDGKTTWGFWPTDPTAATYP